MTIMTCFRQTLFQLLAAALLLVVAPTGLPVVTGVTPAAAAEARYTCGMHPMIVTDEPGLCPICEMALTPLKEGSGQESNQVITIDPVTSQKMGIRTAEVAERQLTHTIHTVGLADYEEPGQYVINSKVAGWVEKLAVNQVGQTVRMGEPLFSIFSPELVAAQEELLIALANFRSLEGSDRPEIAKDAGDLLSAARQRLAYWDISPAQIKELERSGKVSKKLTLFAPAAGVVSDKQVRDGAYITAGQELMEISSLKTIWVFADIYEDEIPWVKVGQAAEVSFPFLDQPIRGTINTIYPYLDGTTRTVKARIDLANPDLVLKPEMYADVTIHTTPVGAALAIPVEAVLFTGRQETVFLALNDGKFEPRQIRTGRQDETGYIEVLAGLTAGERVVTSAQFMLDSESKLREAIQKMREPVGTESKPSGGLDDLF